MCMALLYTLRINIQNYANKYHLLINNKYFN